MVTLELDGYETNNTTLTPSMGGAVAGNILAGGLIGWGVDAANGSQYNLNPNAVSVRLRAKAPVASIAATRPPASAVADLLAELDQLDMLRKGGKITEEEYARLRSVTLAKFQ